MVNKIEVEGYSALLEAVKPFEGTGKKVFVLFSGSKDEKTGKSSRACTDIIN